jgi:drug/metabolite transporter (DMT)-like permease
MIWSTSFTVTKIGLASLSPLSTGALRFIFAAVIPGVVLATRRSFVKIGFRDVARFAAGGVLGVTVYSAFQGIGVWFALVSHAALIVASYLVITMLLGMLLFRTKPQWHRVSVIALKEPLALAQLLGGLTVVLGVVFSTYPSVRIADGASKT